MKTGKMRLGDGWDPAGPLWRRVPARGDDGKPLSDFMMLIPRLRHWPSDRIQRTLDEIHAVLHQYDEVVVFADLNVQLNLLWVSVKAVPRICVDLPAAVQARVPEARLVANRVEAVIGEASRASRPAEFPVRQTIQRWLRSR